MNLRIRQRRVWCSRGQAATYFLSTPSSIFSLELSSGAFSAGALGGMVAPDVFLEWCSDDVVEPGRVFSAAEGSAMASARTSLRRGDGRVPSASLYQRWSMS